MSTTRQSILYLGDTSLSSAAGYLAGLMTRFGLDYEAVSQRNPGVIWLGLHPGTYWAVATDNPRRRSDVALISVNSAAFPTSPPTPTATYWSRTTPVYDRRPTTIC